MNERRIHTFCRVCEPACGLVATVRDGALQTLEPDRDHPVTRGFACHKGLAAKDVHLDPDRVDRPLERGADGAFHPVGWDQALRTIAGRLRGIIDRAGPDAVSAYIGNPAGFNALAGPAVRGFLRQLGVERTFSSGTQDCANKFAGSEAVFGTSTLHPIPDLEHTDYLLIFGENPAVSHMSFLAIPDPMAVLRAAKARGATIRFVNPRRIESAGSVGDVIQIRPDTDLYLLAAMLDEIDRTVGFAAAVVAEHGRNVEALRTFVRRYPADRVASTVGIPAEEIRRLAHEFAAAPRAAAHMSTGVNMGRQGTTAYWLLHMLSFVTGNLDRRGGNVVSEGFYRNAKAGRRRFADSFEQGPHGALRRGNLPGNLMAEIIRDPARPIRALIVVAGNPLLSIDGEEKLRRALAGLELLVVVDLYRNATAELAHFVLPATDMLEREDLNLVGLGLQHRPWVQWTDRVVLPRGERREEWWIFARLAQEMDLPSVLDHGAEEAQAKVWERIDHMLGTRGHHLADLRREPHGITFGEHQPGGFYQRHLQTEDRRVDCCPAAFAPALERAELLFGEMAARPQGLLLISKRDRHMHNSWYANVERMKPRHHDRTCLHMHPDDADERRLAAGELVRVANEHGTIELPLLLDDTLRPGVVAVPHGGGHRGAPAMRVAHAAPGVNVNRLLPTGPGSFEPLSSQAHMTGIPVSVEAAAGPSG